MSHDTTANDNGVALATLLFRVLRNASMHDVQGLEAQGVLDGAADSLREMCRKSGGFITLLFAEDSVFANGQPIRTTRAVYDNVLEVGRQLESVKCNEITVRSTVSGRDLAVFLRIVAKHERGLPLPTSLSLQNVDPAAMLEEDEELTITEQVAAVYGASVVLVRRCNEQVMEDDLRPLRHVKRVAQRLVALSERGFAELLALARRPPPAADRAAIAVNAGIIAALTMRSLTGDIHVALRATMGAFQSEIGRPRIAGMYRADGFQTPFVPQLNQQMRQRLPASTAVMLFEAGGGAERPMLRAVAAYEAAQLADAELLGWPYQGQIPPSVEAIIASLAVRVAAAMAEFRTPDLVVRALTEVNLGKIERAGLELIYAMLGLVPTGAPVEMTTARRGVVVSSGDSFTQLERPRIVLLVDDFRNRIAPRVVQAGGADGWVRTLVGQPDAALNDAYQAYLQTRSSSEPSLPSTTGIIEPEAADHITDRASLHFEVDEATGRIDGAAAAAALGLVINEDPLPPPRQRFNSGPVNEPLPQRPAPSLNEPLPSPRFESPPAAVSSPSVPSQFQPPAPAQNEIPPQFQPFQSSAPPQFQTSDAPPQFQRPTAGSKPNDVWEAPKVAPPAREETVLTEDEEEEDFDALANIVLFD